jgi:hypothetical protein
MSRLFRFTILNELCLGGAALVVLGAVLIPAFPGHDHVCPRGHWQKPKMEQQYYFVRTRTPDGKDAFAVELHKNLPVWVCDERGN